MGSCFSKKKGSSSFSLSVAAAATTSISMADPNNSHTNGDTGCENSITHEVTVDSYKPMMKLKSDKTMPATQEDQKVEEDDQGGLVKEIIVVKRLKSHEDRGRRGRDSRSPPPQQDAPLVPLGLASTTAAATCTTFSIESAAESMVDKVSQAAAVGVGVRTSSCTKEEVDAILIRCGRLSQSPSGKAAGSSASCDRSRKYSGSKRSYDFAEVAAADDDQKKANVFESDDMCEEDERQLQQSHRQSSKPSSSSQGRRRTPSRERDRDQKQRSSSRERRVSRSPGRRSSENTTPARTTTGSAPTAANAIRNGNRPGKIISVPATVSSLVMDKSNNGGGGRESATATDAKRISIRKNVGNEAVTAGSRYAASPRSKSPSRAKVLAKISNDNQQLQPSLSRSSSKKGEQSPYRRNPLSEIDPNSLSYSQPINSSSTRVQSKNKKETEEEGIAIRDSTCILNPKPNTEIKNSAFNNRTGVQGANYKISSRGTTLDNQVVSVNCIPKEKKQSTVEEGEEPQLSMTRHVTAKTVFVSGAESQNPRTPSTRTRYSRRSRDLDLNPETLLNPNPSYATLLLENIQNFHQKNSNTTSVHLPPCVTKACSILEAVADLNSATSSNLSCAFSEDRRSPPTHQSNRIAYNFPLAANLVGNTVADTKEPFIESEIAVADDVMEPSFHKYVTVRRGCVEDMEDQ